MAVGFIVGLKAVYVDKVFSEANMTRVRKRRKKRGTSSGFEHLDGNKVFFIIGCTVLGFYVFYLDTLGTFKRKQGEE